MKKILSLALAVVMTLGVALSSGYVSVDVKAESVDAIEQLADTAHNKAEAAAAYEAASLRSDVLRKALPADVPSTKLEDCIDLALESAVIPTKNAFEGSYFYDNYDVLSAYITNNSNETLDDCPAVLVPGFDEDTGYMWYFAVSKRDSSIRFEFFLTSDAPSYYGVLTYFDLNKRMTDLNVTCSLVACLNDEVVGASEVSLKKIEHSKHYRGKQYTVSSTGGYFTDYEFEECFNITFNLLCDYYDVALLGMNVCGISALGFDIYEGCGVPACDNVHLGKQISINGRPASCIDGYSGDTVCTYCGKVTPGHSIPGRGPHTFLSDCDINCDNCGLYRDVTEEHTYDSSYDSKCNKCGYVREVSEKYTSKKVNPPVLMNRTSTSIALAPRDGYEYSVDGVTWQDSNVFEELSFDTEYTFRQRIAETEDTYTSEVSTAITVRTLPKPACSIVPFDPVVADYNSSSITLARFPGYEYSLDGETWQNSVRFFGLNSNTEYTVYQRVRETKEEKASGITSTTVKTTVAGTTTADNFDKIVDYVLKSANEEMDGCPASMDIFPGNNSYYLSYAIVYMGSHLRFYIISGRTVATYTATVTYFDLFRNDKTLNVTSVMMRYENNEIVDAVDIEGGIDRSTYIKGTEFTTDNKSSMYFTAKQFEDNFNYDINALCEYYDQIIYDIGAGGLEGVGFYLYDGIGTAVCDPATSYHTGETISRNSYTAGCIVAGHNSDKYCSHCEQIIKKGSERPPRSNVHTYDNDCDTDCNYCEQQRITEHQYSSECDDTCNSCSFVREVNTAHVYDSEYDMECNCCGYTVSGDINGTPYNNLLYFIDGGEVKIVGCTDTATSAIIPETIAGYPVTGIGAKAFNNCTALESLTILASISYIEEGAFAGCDTIENIFYAGTEEEWNALDNRPEYVNITFNYVPAYIPGDIDGVEGVTDADAVYLLMHTFFSDMYPVDQPCDFNGDGAVTDADAVYLLMYTFFPDMYPIG